MSEDSKNLTSSYDSMSEAAKALNISKTSIFNYFDRNQLKPYKGRYIFTKIIQ